MAVQVRPFDRAEAAYSHDRENMFRRDLETYLFKLSNELRSVAGGSSPEASLAAKRELFLSLPIGITDNGEADGGSGGAGSFDSLTVSPDGTTVQALTVNGLATFGGGMSGSGAGLSSVAASTVTVTDSTSNEDYPVVFNDESDALLDDTGAFTYNPSDGTLTATTFDGAFSGTVTDATNAANVAVTATSTGTTFFPTFVDISSGNQPIEVDTDFKYNASTGMLSLPSVDLSGAARCAQVELEEFLTSNSVNLQSGNSTVNYTFKYPSAQGLDDETLRVTNDAGATSTLGWDTPVWLDSDQTIGGTKTFSSTIVGSVNGSSGSTTGNAGTVTNGVYTTGDQTIGGAKTFSSTISGSIDGNSGTVTNGVYTTGDQTIGGAKTFSSTISGDISGNAAGTAATVTAGNQSAITGVGALSTGSIATGFTAIANARLANSAVTVGSTSIALGATGATIAGLSLTTPVLGTPISGTLTNCGGTADDLTAGNATNATKVDVSLKADDVEYYLAFTSGVTGNLGINVDGDLRYNPNTNALTVGSLLGQIHTSTQNSILNMPFMTSAIRLETVGALSSGSIASGFGTINVGANSITGGAGSFTTINGSTSLKLASGETVTGIDDGALGSSAVLLATQGAIKTYVDAQVTTQDLDIVSDSGNIDIDLGSESLTVTGGTGVDTSATGTTVTFAIDSSVATKDGSQELKNKTISGSLNSLSNIANGSLTNSSLIVGSTEIALGATAATISGLTLDAPALGTPGSGVLTNCTGTANSLIVGTATNATNATNVDVSLKADSADYHLAFMSGTTGNLGINVDSHLTYNPSTNVLTVGGLLGQIHTTSQSNIENIPFMTSAIRLETVGALSSGSIAAGFTAIDNARLANSSLTIGGTTIALGETGQIGLNDLDDVDNSGWANNEVLTYQSDSSKWESLPPVTGGLSAVLGGVNITEDPVGGATSPVTLNLDTDLVGLTGINLTADLGAAVTDKMVSFRQPTALGSTDGNYQQLTDVRGDVSEQFFVNDFLIRNDSGSDWLTSEYRRGVSINFNYHLPTTLRSWYNLNPAGGTSGNGEITFGSNGTTYGGFDLNGLSLGTSSDYVNFGAGSGSTGFGIRNNSGVVESKNSGGEWHGLATIPTDSVTTGANKLEGDGTTTVTVTDAGTTERNSGDRVVLSGQTTGTDAGLTPAQINGAYEITAVSSTTYTIEMPAAALAVTFGDATMRFEYFTRSSTSIQNGFSLQGKFDIGPLRFIFNKWNSTNAETVTLGDGGQGTANTMHTQLYTVFCVQAEDDGTSQNTIANVINGTLKGGALTFMAGPRANTREAAYIAIGDSGV